jgi:pantetheine-phosphate adenylyltransferase
MIAVYPGSFDPVTLGHLDIVGRASRLFDKVIVGIAHNPEKKHWLTAEERLNLVLPCISVFQNVEVKIYQGLTVSFVADNQANVIIRGLRALSDFEHEFMMSHMNKNLAPGIETVFMMAGLEYQFLSSSMVKQVMSLKGDVKNVLPASVYAALQQKIMYV